MSKFKFTWGHGVMLMLGSFMLFILTLIYLADETGDLVTDDYYEESLVYQENSIDAVNRAKELAAKPEIKEQANGYLVQFPTEIKSDSGQLYLMRGAYKKDDMVLPLDLNARNQVLIPASQLKPGEYDLKLTWFLNGESYIIKKTLQWKMP